MPENEGTTAPATPKKGVKTEEAKTIAMTFKGDDLKVFHKIEALAKKDRRSNPEYLLIWLEKNFEEKNDQ